MEGRLGPAVLGHARALVAVDAGALDGLTDEFEAMGWPLLTAEVAARAAVLHRRAGRPGPADAATGRARSLARACEGARAPELELLGSREELTRRELEVARRRPRADQPDDLRAARGLRADRRQRAAPRLREAAGGRSA